MATLGGSVLVSGPQGAGGAWRGAAEKSAPLWYRYARGRKNIHRLTNTGTVSTFGSTNLWHPGRTVLPGHTTRILTGTRVGSKAQHARKIHFLRHPPFSQLKAGKSGHT